MSHGELQGWCADPFQLHEQRYFSAGQPTKLVRDGRVESYDEPPSTSFEVTGPQAAAEASVAATQPPGWTNDQPERLSEQPAPSGQSPDPVRPQRRPRFGVIYTATVLALLAIAGVVVIVVRGGTGSSGQSSMTDVAYVTRSAQHTAAQRTVDVSLAGTVRGNGQSISVRGTGGINFSTGSSELTMLMTISGRRAVEKEIQVPGAAYFTLTVDGKNLARQIGGRDWIRIPVRSSSAATASGGSPQSALKLLEQHGIAVRGLGPKTIGGVRCTGYSVTPSRQAMLAAAQKMAGSRALPPGVAATLRSITPPTFTIWLDSHGLLRQMTASLQLGGLPGASSGVAADVVENFSGYGTPVQIVAPAASDVLSDQAFVDGIAGASS